MDILNYTLDISVSIDSVALGASIIKKPDYHFIVNSGAYVLEPEIVDLIPTNQPIDMPDLLVLTKKKVFKIQVYPVNYSWFDIGEWREYKRAIEYMDKLK